jgi:hypothetical protein
MRPKSPFVGYSFSYLDFVLRHKRPEKLVVDAVVSEPSSATNSLLTGKVTGNFGNLSFRADFSRKSAATIQWVAAKFPKRRNREITLDIRELAFPDQGIVRQAEAGSVVNNTGAVGSWQNLTSVTYFNGPLSVTVTERIVGAGIISGMNTPSVTNVNHVDGQAYTNLNMTYSIDELGGHYQVYGNINNLFNAAPPVDGGTVVGNTGTTDANKALFDVVGLDFTLGIRFNY